MLAHWATGPNRRGLTGTTMQTKGLRNVIRTETGDPSAPWGLKTMDGTTFEPFNVYCGRNSSDAYATQKRYAEATSRFIDYLFEAEVFSGCLTVTRLNEVVDAYPSFLRDGSDATIRKQARIKDEVPTDTDWKTKVAQNLQWKPVQQSTVKSALAAVNKFLSLSEDLARESKERLSALGLSPEIEPQGVIAALRGNTSFTPYEIASLKQRSMLGALVKFSSHPAQRKRRLQAGREKRKSLEDRDFPLNYLMCVVRAANSWRDKSLWLLLGGSGIRMSEARNILLEDIDFERQVVYIRDPLGRHYRPTANNVKHLRFKGRETAVTYIFQPIRQEFFQAIRNYLNEEFVPRDGEGDRQPLFQSVEPTMRGVPLSEVSDTSLNASFKRALLKGNVPLAPNGRAWWLHSLRHMYGVYMLNDYPLNIEGAIFGLQLVEVQMLMGHANISSTAKYARTKYRRLASKLEASDRKLLGLSEQELSFLPTQVVNRIQNSQ